MAEARTLAQNQFLDLTFAPLKADGSPAQVDHADHDPTWVVDGVQLAGGFEGRGIANFNLAGDGMACRVFAGGPAGGLQSYAIVVNGDADLTGGEVRDVQWSLTLDLTVLADEATEGAGTVGQPTEIPPPQP